MFFNNAVPRGGAIEEKAMRKLIASLVALLFGAALLATPADAGTLKGYYYNSHSLEEIASAVDSSLARDPSGNALIAPGKCRTDASCATANAYRASFNAHDPDANLTSVNQVAGYLRSLIKDCTVTGQFEMDAIDMNGGPHARVSGMHRALRAGECVYRNPKTGRIVLAEHCANPIGRQLDTPCAMINIPQGAVLVHVAYADATDKCAATRAAKPYTRDDGKGWKWFTPCSACDFSDFMAYTGWRTTPVGKTPVDIIGQQIRVNPNNRTDLCFEDANGNVSDTVSVRAQDFKRVGGELQATVGPEFIRYSRR